MLTSTQYLVSRTAVPSFHCVMLYYMLAAQLFLQPQSEPYMYSRAVVSLCYFVLYVCCSTISSASARTSHYRRAVVSLCYAVLYICCSTLSSASAQTSHVTQCRRLIVLCCIICLLINSFFSLSPYLTMNTFCIGYKSFFTNIAYVTVNTSKLTMTATAIRV